MWLDGLYMAQPFYAQYSLMFNEPENYDDIFKQFNLVYEKTVDEETGLLYHAWNENKEQKWADKETGRSPHFWGRAMGWYLMALVDVLDFIPSEDNRRNDLIKILNNVSNALVEYRDGETGLLFAPGDFVELASKIKWLWQHPNETVQMGKNACQLYKEKYAPERNYKMLMDIYQKAIDEK